jgi:hypothetical protein
MLKRRAILEDKSEKFQCLFSNQLVSIAELYKLTC